MTLNNRDPIHELDHSSPAAKHVNLGQVLSGLITSVNGMAAAMDATGTKLAALGTVTVGGSITVGDTLTLTFTNASVPALASGLPVAVVAAAGNTPSVLASELSTAVNLSAPLIAAGITSSNTAAANVLSQPGSIGNQTVVTHAVSGGATETITLTNGGTLSGGFGSVGNGNVAAFGLQTLQQRAT